MKAGPTTNRRRSIIGNSTVECPTKRLNVQWGAIPGNSQRDTTTATIEWPQQTNEISRHAWSGSSGTEIGVMNPLHPTRILKTHYPAFASAGSVAPAETSGFSGAAIFRVETDIGPFCLRRWPPGTMPASRLAGIHLLVAEVFQSGITVVPVPVMARSGVTFVEDAGAFWQLEPWMPGEADFHGRPNAGRLESALTTLAQIHDVAESASAAAAQSDIPQTIPERQKILGDTSRELAGIEAGLQQESHIRFGTVARRIVTQFSKRESEIEAAFAEAARHSVPILPCLRDVWHDHLLFSDDALTGLVDFGAVRLDTVAADLSRLLGSLFQSSYASDRARWDEALSIYERTRPLTEAERRLIPILGESGVLLSGTHWLRSRYVRSSLFDIPRVCERLESIAARLESR
jgi:Ser/Thr protein kinase RdoA (MazF antagonist)